jgi:hypothetical protein
LGEGLEIRRPTLARDTDEDGKDVIIVRGVIANVSDKPRTVPLIQVALLDDINQMVQSVRMPPLKTSLQPKEEIGFRARLADVPTARSLEVTFAEPEEGGEAKMPAKEH